MAIEILTNPDELSGPPPKPEIMESVSAFCSSMVFASLLQICNMWHCPHVIYFI